MSNFEKACSISCNDWVNSFPQEIPEYKFSKSFNKKMKSLLNKMRNDKYHKTTKKTLNAILIAAIILAMTITVLAINGSKKHIIKKTGNISSYSVAGNGNKKIDKMNVEYVPSGFDLTDEDVSSISSFYTFENGNGQWFSVDKGLLNNKIFFDNEHGETQVIKQNGITYVRFGYGDETQKDVGGYIWNNGGSAYSFSGNLPKDEALKIAMSAK